MEMMGGKKTKESWWDGRVDGQTWEDGKNGCSRLKWKNEIEFGNCVNDIYCQRARLGRQRNFGNNELVCSM